jgi:Rrf2 family protein
MKLSSAVTYALHALVCLALRPAGVPVTAAEVAEAGGMSHGFLSKALRALESAGVLRSGRGPHGGYRLARPSERITVLEVVEAVDGPVRGEVPRWAPKVGQALDGRLQAVCDAAAEPVRERLGSVSVANLAGRRAAP